MLTLTSSVLITHLVTMVTFRAVTLSGLEIIHLLWCKHQPLEVCSVHVGISGD